MSVHTTPAKTGHGEKVKKITAIAIRKTKGVCKVSVITAYDFPTAVMVDEAGVDIVLVGDSLGMVVLGREDTLGVTLDDMIHHTKAVVRGVHRALVVTDLPFMTYEPGVDTALANVAALVSASGVRAVKLEGGREVLPQIQAIVRAGIPVMGHLGLTPQRVSTLGGFTVQARTAAAAAALLEDAFALEAAGCFALVLEAVPAPVAELVTRKLSIPTIGIGAGAGCDGQVLVLHDMLGLTSGHIPRFVKPYAHLADEGRKAVQQYVKEVREGMFPTPEHSFTMAEEEQAALAERFEER